MYYNLELIHSKGFNLTDVDVLQIIKQNRIEENEDHIAMYINDDKIAMYEAKGLVKLNAAKRKADSDFSRMRLTKKGLELLEVFETPELAPGDDDMFNYLVDMYLNGDEERTVGNKKKTRMYCAVFRQHLNLSLHEMYWLCTQFTQDYPYSKKLEYIFFNANKNRYGKFVNNLEDSPLYQFLDEHKEKIESLWALKIENYEENFS